MDAIERRLLLLLLLLLPIENFGVDATMHSIGTVGTVAAAVVVGRPVLRRVHGGQLNRPRIVAALLGAHGASHVSVVKEALVETHETHLAVGDPAVIALIAAGLGLEGGRVALQSIFEYA